MKCEVGRGVSVRRTFRRATLGERALRRTPAPVSIPGGAGGEFGPHHRGQGADGVEKVGVGLHAGALQVQITLMRFAAAFLERWFTMKSQFLRPRAIGRMAFSAGLLSIPAWGASTNRVSRFQ